jgi:hypothetical protein
MEGSFNKTPNKEELGSAMLTTRSPRAIIQFVECRPLSLWTGHILQKANEGGVVGCCAKAGNWKIRTRKWEEHKRRLTARCSCEVLVFCKH